VESQGALNFLAFDDVPVVSEGTILDPQSIISLDCGDGSVPPHYDPELNGPLLTAVDRSGRKWVVLTDEADRPQWVLDADAFLRKALNHRRGFDLCDFAHRPIVVRDPGRSLGSVIQALKVDPEHKGDNVIDQDVILYWGEEKRIITGADILGRLLHGIVGNMDLGRV
jgi:metal transporter CNNM